MANETTQGSDLQGIPDADECCENIPPGPKTSKLGVQAEDAVDSSFTQLSEGNWPLSDNYTMSTPAPKVANSGITEKSRLSVFQSALTPILKYLNIGNNRPSPDSLKHVNSTDEYLKSIGESVHHPSSDLTTIPSGGGKATPVCLLDFEYLPEITFLDSTCDPTVEMTTNESELCERAPVTPKAGKEEITNSPDLPKLIEKTSPSPNTRPDVLSKNKSSPVSSRILERYLPEITLLDVTCDSEQSPVGQTSSVSITQDASPHADIKIDRDVSKLGEDTESSGTIQNEDQSSTSLQSVKCLRENAIKISLDVSQDITMGSNVENSKSLSELRGENEKLQASIEEALDAKAVNITHDRSSSHEMPSQSADLSPSGLKNNPSSDGFISEGDSESTENQDKMEVVNEELLIRCDTELASKVSHQNSEVVASVNGTLTLTQPSNLSTFSDLNSTASISCPENKTLDLPPPSVNISKECESTDETQSATTDLPCVVNQACSAVKENQNEVQNATFDRCSLQKSSGSTPLGEDVTTSLPLQNNTFDCKPATQLNATITLSEMSSNNSRHSTFDKPSSPKVCSLTISLKESTSEVHPPEMPKEKATPVAAEPNVSMHENPNGTFETNPVLESASGSGESKSKPKDQSESGLPVTDGLSDASSHHSVETESNKGDVFNLDETLDLKADPMITSTPMPNSKIFSCDKEREAGKTLAAQKKLYGDGPGKPDDQAPSNIVCGRKTFFTQNAPKFLKPPSKVTSQLLKNKPASTLPTRLEPVTSGLPMKKLRTQPELVRNPASQDPPRTTGIPSSYNLRSTTAASKLPSCGLQKAQLSSIPSVVQRARPGLRPPSAGSNMMSSSSTEKPCGSTAASAVTRSGQGKKHQLTKGEALPVTKRKRMDPVVPPSTTEASTPACDATNKTKNIKQPTAGQRSLPARSQRTETAVPPTAAEFSALCDMSSRGRAIKQPASSHKTMLTKSQSHDCAKCSILEGQLKEKSEEIQRLKEELLKYKKQEDC